MPPADRHQSCSAALLGAADLLYLLKLKTNLRKAKFHSVAGTFTHLRFLRIFANQRGLLGPSPRTLRFREHSLTALIDTHFPQSRVTWCQAAQCRHCYNRGLKRKMAAHKSLNTPISWPGRGKRVFVFLQGLGAGKCAKLLIRGSSQYQGRL